MANVDIHKSKVDNTGAFAKKDLKKDDQVIQYVGEVISSKESDRRAAIQLEKHQKDPSQGGVYIFTIDDDWDIDGNVPWNPAKYLNHSCNPNCESQIDDDDEVFLIAIKDIKKGDELFFDYGYDVDNYLEHPCRCGSKNCVGYIVAEDQWPKLKKLLKKHKKA